MTLGTSRAVEQPVEAFCPQAHLSYLEAGAGADAVVLLHGWGAFKELWWSTMLALAPRMHAFAPDLELMAGEDEPPIRDLDVGDDALRLRPLELLARIPPMGGDDDQRQQEDVELRALIGAEKRSPNPAG